jgi:hypothetical protein
LTTKGNRSRSQVLITALGSAGVLLIFLPFTWSTSPLSAVIRGRSANIWQLGLPFFLAILVTVASIRRLVSGRWSRSETIVDYITALIMMCVTLSLYGRNLGWPIDLANLEWPQSTREQFAMSIPLLSVIIGVPLILRNRRRGLPEGWNAVVSMQIAYFANGLLCLLAFIGDWQIGAYLTLFTIMVYLIQISRGGHGVGPQ